jgi:16S rRNA (cytosine967-C5)-methyltransferase
MKTPHPPFVGRRHDARSLALQVLFECHRGNGFVQDILDRQLAQHPLSPADRRLATQLAYGVLRRRGTLDALLRPLVAREPHQIEPWLWEALRLGAFQLALLTHIPPHAALHETVELASAFQRPRAKGFLNAVLRKLAALVTEAPASEPSADALPLENGRYRKLARPVLPDPAAHRLEYLATAFGWPRWLAARWLERFGWDECVRLGFWFAGPAPLWLRTNPLRVTREAFLAALAEAGIAAAAGDHPQAVRLVESVPVRELPGYADGWFAVQDQTAMRVASALAPAPGSRVLDVCAAPGGKATHLAELMGNRGTVVASDVDGRRLETVRALSERLGITILETCRVDPEPNAELPAGPFDAVLVDVPCSNTGVLGRRPEARWRLRPVDLGHLVLLQTRLLLQAAERVRPGGIVVYSTCSIEPEENQQVVQNVLRALRWLKLEGEEVQVPGRPADGGYWARLKRKEIGKDTLA